MIKKQNLIIISLLMVLMSSCTSIPTRRISSSQTLSKNWNELSDLKHRKVELAAISFHFQKKKNEIQLKKIQSEQKNIDKKISEIESSITAFDRRSNTPFLLAR